MERQGIYYKVEDGVTESMTEEVRCVRDIDGLRQIAARFALGKELTPIELSQINDVQIAGGASIVSPRLNYQLEIVEPGTTGEHRIETFGRTGEKQASFEPKPGGDHTFVITYKTPMHSNS